MMAQQAQRVSLNTCTCFCSTAAIMPVIFGFPQFIVDQAPHEREF